eukprot:SAG11_NODE_5234_length_1621_cov_10.515769_2_plen_68_part_00
MQTSVAGCAVALTANLEGEVAAIKQAATAAAATAAADLSTTDEELRELVSVCAWMRRSVNLHMNPHM